MEAYVGKIKETRALRAALQNTMSILDLMVDLRAAKTEEEFEAAHARFQQRKQAQPTVGEQVTAKLRNSTMPDGNPAWQSSTSIRATAAMRALRSYSASMVR